MGVLLLEDMNIVGVLPVFVDCGASALLYLPEETSVIYNSCVYKNTKSTNTIF